MKRTMPKNETETTHSNERSEERGSLGTILSRASPFPNETGSLPIGEFEPSEGGDTAITGPLLDSKVLVVGAGGLGCEVLKNLAMSGIRNVDVIDLDSIDLTNLNRQFLFRENDIGKSKAEVAATFIEKRCPWMKVTPHHGKIQDKPIDFYEGFNCVISGLDNVEARRWLNSALCGLVQIDEDGDPDPTTIIPLVDGGSEGLKGQARLILPRITSCFECSLDSFPPQNTYPLCTVAETPRLPQHCIAWAYLLQWPKHFPDTKLDTDSPQHMQWLYKTASERAETYHIKGVTYHLTLGVVKNIIPAVASTNAVIAAACVNEVVKLLSFASQSLNTYMMYMGSQGLYSHTFVYERNPECPVCSSVTRILTVSTKYTLNQFLQQLKEGELRLKKPSAVSDKTLYMPNPPALEKATRKNLDRPLRELLGDGDEVVVTDEVIANSALSFRISFE